jgi:hypothetical protein
VSLLDFGDGRGIAGRTSGLTIFRDRFRGPRTSLQAEHPPSGRSEEQHTRPARGQGDDGEDRSCACGTRIIIEEKGEACFDSKNLAFQERYHNVKILRDGNRRVHERSLFSGVYHLYHQRGRNKAICIACKKISKS